MSRHNTSQSPAIKDRVQQMISNTDGLSGYFSFDRSTQTDWEVENGKYTIALNSAGSMTLTFDHLDKLSNLFQSKRLTFEPQSRTEGYCDTCRYEEKYVEVLIEQASL